MSEYPAGLSFTVLEENGELRACYTPSEHVHPPTVISVKEQLAAEGYGGCIIHDNALNNFTRLCFSAAQPVEDAIGQCIDGTFDLVVERDLMLAWLTMTPPQGGKSRVEDVRKLMQKQNIIHGVQTAALEAALATHACKNVMIAQGDEPGEGTPAVFETLFDKEMEKTEKDREEDAHAVVQLRDISRLKLVHPGDLLMRRHPPVPGKNGMNVLGEVVMARSLPDVRFTDNLLGADVHPEDEYLLVATAGGMTSVLACGVSVNPVLDVENVDMETGNIRFEGTLNVAGDIRSGMCIKVTGDVVVKGAVEAAEIIADGNVMVQGGIIGRSEGRPGVDALPATTARIICGGSLQALFADSAHLDARDSIVIKRQANHCELRAGKTIFLGEGGPRGGYLMGGVILATDLVECNVLGSDAGIKTRVHVGLDPYLDEELTKKKQAVQKKMTELDRVLQLQRHLQQNPQKDKDGLGGKIENTRLQLTADIEASNVELATLAEQLKTVDQARIVVHRALHFGSEVHVGQQVLQVGDDMGSSVIRLKEGEIVIDH